ncbi:MAG TPA: hypothetical protein VE869_13115 [Gemmatimonas sp.]|nr:hypothetical protein [Gemmatimonas sp.]
MLPARSHIGIGVLSALALGCALGCAPALPDTPPLPGESLETPLALRVDLIDSIPYGEGPIEVTLHRVTVSTARWVDTLPDILVADRPVVGDDNRVIYGLRAIEEQVVGLFLYEAATRQVRALPVPKGWWPATSPRLAPDGRHVAFLAQDANGESYAAIAELPGGKVIYRGPRATLLETDTGVDDIRWIDANRVEIMIDLSVATGGVQRVRGTVAPLALQVDTVRTERED